MRNRIDKIFREKLKDSELDYSKELWANIEAEIFPKKSNRYSGLWLLSLGALFLIPMYLLKDMYSAAQPDAIPGDYVAKEIKQSALNEKSPLYPFDNLNNPKAIENEIGNNSNSKTTSELQINTATAETGVSSSIQNVFATKDSRIKNNDNNDLLSNNAIDDLLVLSTDNYLIVNNDVRKLENEINLNNNVFRVITNSKNKKNTNILGTNSNVKETPSDLSRKSFRIRTLDTRLDYQPKGTVITTDYCDDRKLNPNKYYSEIYAGFGFAHKTYSSSTAFEDYKNIRKDSESLKLSFDAGFRIGYQFMNDFLIESGFEYSQYNYSVAYKDGVMVTTHITIDTIISGGMIQINIDTTVTETFTPLHTNLKHQNLEIPLLIGKEFDINSKFSLAIKTGVALNIYSQSSGEMLDSEERLLNIANDGTTVNNNYFKSNFGFSIPFQAQLYFKVSPEIDLFAKAGLRYYPGTISRDAFEIKDKISYNNLGVGLRVQI